MDLSELKIISVSNNNYRIPANGLNILVLEGNANNVYLPPANSQRNPMVIINKTPAGVNFYDATGVRLRVVSINDSFIVYPRLGGWILNEGLIQTAAIIPIASSDNGDGNGFTYSATNTSAGSAYIPFSNGPSTVAWECSTSPSKITATNPNAAWTATAFRLRLKAGSPSVTLLKLTDASNGTLMFEGTGPYLSTQSYFLKLSIQDRSFGVTMEVTFSGGVGGGISYIQYYGYY